MLTRCFVLCFGIVVGAQGQPEVFPGRDKTVEGVFRFMDWNVWHSSVLPPNGARRESFVRILQALKPDVVCLEAYMSPTRRRLGGT